jgi:hypothetical protein
MSEPRVRRSASGARQGGDDGQHLVFWLSDADLERAARLIGLQDGRPYGWSDSDFRQRFPRLRTRLVNSCRSDHSTLRQVG